MLFGVPPVLCEPPVHASHRGRASYPCSPCPPPLLCRPWMHMVASRAGGVAYQSLRQLDRWPGGPIWRLPRASAPSGVRSGPPWLCRQPRTPPLARAPAAPARFRARPEPYARPRRWSGGRDMAGRHGWATYAKFTRCPQVPQDPGGFTAQGGFWGALGPHRAHHGLARPASAQHGASTAQHDGVTLYNTTRFSGRLRGGWGALHGCEKLYMPLFCAHTLGTPPGYLQLRVYLQ
jgi:hypothetical protein